MNDDFQVDPGGNGFRIPIIIAIVVVVIMVTAVLPGINMNNSGSGSAWSVPAAITYLNTAGYQVWATGGLTAGGIPIAQADNTLATDAELTYNSTSNTLSTGQLKDAALTSGRVVISTTDGQLTDDSDLSFSGDTLTATKFAGDGSALTGLPSGCTVGTTFPVSPSEGDFFLHSVTGRDILYQYVNSAWNPIQNYGNITIYVDATDGTDDLLHGTGVNTNAFKTLAYAWAMLPSVIQDGYRAKIYLSPEAYSETIKTNEITSTSKTGWISIYGTMITTVSGATATGGLQGSGANVPYVSGTFTANEYDNKIISFTSGANNGTKAIIGLTSTTKLYLISNSLTAQPQNGDTYDILDFGTIITGNWLFWHCNALVYLNYLSLTASSTYSGIGGIIWALDSSISCNYSLIRNPTNAVIAILADEKSLVEGYNCILGSCKGVLGGSLDLEETKLYGNATDDGSKGVYLDRLAQANLNWVDISNFNYGVNVHQGAQTTLYDASIYNRIHGCGWGVISETGASVSWMNTVFGINLEGSADANPSGDKYSDDFSYQGAT